MRLRLTALILVMATPVYAQGVATSSGATSMVNIADPSHVGHVNVWDGRLLIAGFSTALVSVALSSTGRGIARALSASSSFALIVLFYIDGLATSI